MSEDSVEGSTKLNVEDGVDERVEEAVDVAEPDEEREEQRVEVTGSAVVEQVVADAHGVDDVDRKERNPTEHEHACTRQRHLAIENDLSLFES